jgi:membrane protease subunit HflK
LPEVLAPGLQWRMPPPIENLTQVDMEVVRRLSVLEVDTPLLSGDQSMVSLKAVVHYRVSDAHDYAYGCLVPQDVLSAVARSSLVEAVGERSQDEVLTVGRAPLEQEVLTRIQEAVDRVELGLVVIGVGLSEAVVPPAVTSAFMDVISAAEEKRTRINLAEAYAAKTVPVARGGAVEVLEASEGEAAAIESRAEVHYAQVTAWIRGGSASSQTTLFRLGRESLERALEGTRIVLAPPSVRVWQGDIAVDPQRLGNPNSEGRRSP